MGKHPNTSNRQPSQRKKITGPNEEPNRENCSPSLQQHIANLEKNETHYRTLVNHIHLGIMVLDSELTILMANQAQARILDTSIDDLVGQKCYDMVCHRESMCEECPNRQVYLTGHPSTIEMDLTTASGKHRSILLRAYPDLDENGRDQGLVVVMEDVTEKKKLERQLIQAQKMEAIGTLAGGIAHDFNNILGAILGFTELGLMDLPEDDPVREYLQEILQASSRAKDLVAQIMAFSRQKPDERAPLQLTPIIKESLKLLRSSLPASIDIRQNIHAFIDVVESDPSDFQQVFMNLCTNAAQAMEDSGGTLSVELDNERLSQSEDDLPPGLYCKLVVSDTGIGIPPESMERIFDPYFTTRPPGSGSGLGLSVVHGIIKNHSGSIRIQAAADGGTTATILLPVNSQAAMQHPLEKNSLAGGRERIMLVDDEKALIEVGRILLERLGYRVQAMDSSTEALELFEEDPTAFDLIVTDRTMPRLSGLDLARRMLERQPDLPVIMCTGLSDRHFQEKCRQTGVRHIINKPVIFHELADVIRLTLDT